MKYLLLLLLVGCATPTFKAAVISLPAEQFPMGGHAGRTTCAMNGVPIVIINPEIVGTIAEILVLAHEQVHVQQLYTFKGGCFKALKLYTEDNSVKLRWEFEAYCATFEKAQSLGLQTEQLWENIKLAVRNELNADIQCSTQGVARQVLGIDRGG